MPNQEWYLVNHQRQLFYFILKGKIMLWLSLVNIIWKPIINTKEAWPKKRISNLATLSRLSKERNHFVETSCPRFPVDGCHAMGFCFGIACLWTINQRKSPSRKLSWNSKIKKMTASKTKEKKMENCLISIHLLRLFFLQDIINRWNLLFPTGIHHKPPIDRKWMPGLWSLLGFHGRVPLVDVASNDETFVSDSWETLATSW